MNRLEISGELLEVASLLRLTKNALENVIEQTPRQDSEQAEMLLGVRNLTELVVRQVTELKAKIETE